MKVLARCGAFGLSRQALKLRTSLLVFEEFDCEEFSLNFLVVDALEHSTATHYFPVMDFRHYQHFKHSVPLDKTCNRNWLKNSSFHDLAYSPYSESMRRQLPTTF